MLLELKAKKEFYKTTVMRIRIINTKVVTPASKISIQDQE
jgi:hypothetical protein